MDIQREIKAIQAESEITKDLPIPKMYRDNGTDVQWFPPCDCHKKNLQKLNNWPANSTGLPAR